MDVIIKVFFNWYLLENRDIKLYETKPNKEIIQHNKYTFIT